MVGGLVGTTVAIFVILSLLSLIVSAAVAAPMEEAAQLIEASRLGTITAPSPHHHRTITAPSLQATG